MVSNGGTLRSRATPSSKLRLPWCRLRRSRSRGPRARPAPAHPCRSRLPSRGDWGSRDPKGGWRAGDRPPPARAAPSRAVMPRSWRDARLQGRAAADSAAPDLIPKGVDIDSFHGGKTARRVGAVRSAMRGPMRMFRGQAPQRPPAGRFAPPKAAISRPLTAQFGSMGRPACGSPTPWPTTTIWPRLVSGQDLSGEMGQYRRPLV